MSQRADRRTLNLQLIPMSVADPPPCCRSLSFACHLGGASRHGSFSISQSLSLSGGSQRITGAARASQ